MCVTKGVLCLFVQSCPTLCDPMDCSPPGPAVPGVSPGKEYWSGLPCPPPGDLPNSGIELRFPILQVDSLPSVHKGSPRILEWVAYPFSRELPDPGIEPGSPALQADSLPAELPGKPVMKEVEGGQQGEKMIGD